MADAEYDFAPELVRLQRDFLAAEERWAQAASDGDAEAIEEAYREAQHLEVALSQHEWLAAQDNRFEARIALRKTARDALSTRLIAHTAASKNTHDTKTAPVRDARTKVSERYFGGPEPASGRRRAGSVLQRQAWQWAQENRSFTGKLPPGRAIAEQFERCERWGRLVKQAGLAGHFSPIGTSH